jgi:[CysO sulfur-carrier protein]-S-L-cysteine hydrolase
MLTHVVASRPEEGCGLLAVDASGEVVHAYGLDNIDRSTTSFTVDPDGHFAALTDAEAHGWSIAGVFHSHPSGPAALSPVDLAAPIDPDWIHVVIGLADPAHPEVRAWRVEGGRAREVVVE